MIAYKYKLYRTPKTKHLDAMLREACFVWNHALALQKRYYKMYHKYISDSRMRKHFAKRIHRHLLHSQTTQEIIDRLDTAYQRFFEHLAKRPPKFKKAKDFSSFVFRQGGYSLNGNVLTINSIKKRYKFSLSRPYDGKIKELTVKRSPLGEYYVVMVLDKAPVGIRKTHNGASVGIDFGLKKYMTLSDGMAVENPLFLKDSLLELRRRSRNLSKCVPGSRNRERKRLELDRLHKRICDRRIDYQWKLAHDLCRRYDTIILEDLVLEGMRRRWGRKVSDLAHGDFVLKLQYVATKYGVTVHKVDRFYASSKTCVCGFVNNELRLSDRRWTCPACGMTHDRDLLAAQNIYRQGIADLASDCKTSRSKIGGRSRLQPRISSL